MSRIKWRSPPSSSSVEVRSPYRGCRRSEEVWPSFHAPQLSGNSAGCGCHHLHRVDIRYGGKSERRSSTRRARWKDVRLNFSSLLSPRGPVKSGWKEAPFTASELQFAQKRGRKTSTRRQTEGTSTNDRLFRLFEQRHPQVKPQTQEQEHQPKHISFTFRQTTHSAEKMKRLTVLLVRWSGRTPSRDNDHCMALHFAY